MKFSSHPSFQKLLEISRDIVVLQGVCSLLEWDQETAMPAKAAFLRSAQLSAVSVAAHSLLVAGETTGLIHKCRELVEKSPEEFNDWDKALVRLISREHKKAVKLPTYFVTELSEQSSKTVETWKKARMANDFSIYQNDLNKMVALKQEEAELLGFEAHPYDALLDQFEEGLTVEFLDATFAPLTEFTIKLLKEITATGIVVDTSLLAKGFAVDDQFEFCKKLAYGLGFDFDTGRISKSTHPFTTSLGTSSDVRFTTRFFENQLSASIMATIHEVGHTLYEQGIDKSLDVTCVGSGTSLGIHESQSRLWENFVGRSESFWKHWLPKLVASFPQKLSSTNPADFARMLSRVAPGFIRVDADELTYNLHILLRYELEKELISDTLKVKDLPEAWNSKMNQYLGIIPDNHSNGVLQDIHWAGGAFGYFPTYSLGNLYAAQIWNAVQKELPNISEYIEKGDTVILLNWLREKIHRHGSVYTASEICVQATGEPLNSWYLMDYLNQKFRKLYGI